MEPEHGDEADRDQPEPARPMLHGLRERVLVLLHRPEFKQQHADDDDRPGNPRGRRGIRQGQIIRTRRDHNMVPSGRRAPCVTIPIWLQRAVFAEKSSLLNRLGLPLEKDGTVRLNAALNIAPRLNKCVALYAVRHSR